MTKLEMEARMNHYIHLYNRLEKAVSTHEQTKAGMFVDDADEALHAAWRRVVKASTKGAGDAA